MSRSTLPEEYASDTVASATPVTPPTPAATFDPVVPSTTPLNSAYTEDDE